MKPPPRTCNKSQSREGAFIGRPHAFLDFGFWIEEFNRDGQDKQDNEKNPVHPCLEFDQSKIETLILACTLNLYNHGLPLAEDSSECGKLMDSTPLIR